jgi:hypothetical protein
VPEELRPQAPRPQRELRPVAEGAAVEEEAVVERLQHLHQLRRLLW